MIKIKWTDLNRLSTQLKEFHSMIEKQRKKISVVNDEEFQEEVKDELVRMIKNCAVWLKDK